MAATLEAIVTAATLTIEPWEDPVVDTLGHDPRSDYAERFWLPVLGPSCCWLLRHLAARLERSPDGCVIELADTARALGLGERSGRNAPFARTIGRAVDFEMAQLRGPDTLAVRRFLPPLARRHLARLPESLRAEHDRLDAEHEETGVERLRRRGRQLALSLVQLGEDADGTERQLMRWRFHPALARECALWAIAQPGATGTPVATAARPAAPGADAAPTRPAAVLAPASVGQRPSIASA